MEEPHQRRISRFRNPVDAASSFYNMTQMQLMYGMVVRALVSVGKVTLDIQTNCLLCLGKCYKDNQGRPTLVYKCEHTSPSVDTVCVCNVDMNGSHHGGIIGVACGLHRVGLDIVHCIPTQYDTVEKQAQFLHLMQTTMDTEEIRQLEELTTIQARIARFTQNWAFKEAFVKALGQGLVYLPQNVSRIIISTEDIVKKGNTLTNADIQLKTTPNEHVSPQYQPLSQWRHYHAQIYANYSLTILQAPTPNINYNAPSSALSSMIQILQSYGKTITNHSTELPAHTILHLACQMLE